MPPLLVSSPTALLVLGALLALLWLGSVAFVRALTRARCRAETAAVEQELAATQRRLGQMEKEQSFQSDFLRQYPSLCEKLTSRLTLRELPLSILEILDRILEPSLALVVFRRKAAAADGQVRSRYFVVATSPRDAPIRPGTEIPVGQGELGFVLEAQRPMSHEDFLRESTAVSWKARTRQDPLSGLRLDLAAPLVFDDEVFGAIAVSGAGRRSALAREVVRLIAQTAALTYYNVAAYRQMKRSAEHDRLTNILNKTSITKHLSHEIVQAEQRGAKVSLVLFDIDNFKHFNDTNGHLNGDKLLSTLAEQVRSMVRNEDSFGRFGGEEFLLVLPETDRAGAMVVAEKVRRLISGHPFPFADNQPLGCISVSGGAATFPDDGRDSTRLLRLADDALYAAKRQGRNRILSANSVQAGSVPA
jgi:diguanylate cyclase (GGDEF)-like protein